MYFSSIFYLNLFVPISTSSSALTVNTAQETCTGEQWSHIDL